MSFAVVAVGGSALLGAAVGIYSAGVQADAAENAANVQASTADRALQLQAGIYQQNRADQEPFRQAGAAALPRLQDLAAQSPEGVTRQPSAPFPGAPSPVPFTGQIDLFRDPSFQFRLQEGQRAVERSAASKGQLQSGNTLRDLTRFGQGLASQEYGAAYQRSLLQNQQQNANIQQQYGNQVTAQQGQYGQNRQDYLLDYNQQQQEQGNEFNRFASLAGLGQTATGQLQQAGQAFGSQAGGNILAAGDARAGGLLGSASAYSAGLQGAGNAVSQGVNQYFGLQQLGRLGSSGGGIYPYEPYGALGGGGYNLTPSGGY